MLFLLKTGSGNVRALLEYKAPVDMKDKAGITPLMVASLRGNLSSVQILLEYGATRMQKNIAE